MFEPLPVACVQDLDPAYSLINSVAFHPHMPVFCATYTNCNALRLFAITPSGTVRLKQKLRNRWSRLAGPQHAVFTPDGASLIVANWISETFTVYRKGWFGRYARRPAQVSLFPAELSGYKPHGIEISPSGTRLAVAFGAALFNPTAIGLFRFDATTRRVQLESLVDGSRLAGIPKGICFSPDGSCLLCTFSNVNALAIYGIDAESGRIDPELRQFIDGPAARLSRPEDIKLTACGRHVVVTNSGSNTLSFHPFDPVANRFIQDEPDHLMEDADSALNFPHGVALSPDGTYMVVTHFGPIATTPDENIKFSNATPANYARITVYRKMEGGGRKEMAD